jgi:hypothetical protein
VATKSHAELTTCSLSGNFIKTEDGKRLLEAVTQVHGESVRPYVVAPNTVRLLRKAFDDTMRDAEFLAEADKAKIDIKPVSGEELEKSVLNVLQLEPGLVAKSIPRSVPI